VELTAIEKRENCFTFEPVLCFQTRSNTCARRVGRGEIHNGSITFLYLAFSPVFRILHKNGFAPIRQKTRFFRQRNKSPHKRTQNRS
jgi:hypothetical protein